MSGPAVPVRLDEARRRARGAPRQETPPPVSLSVITPVYNEAANLDPLFAELHASLSRRDWTWELIAVDDGSSDDSWAVLLSLKARYGDHVRPLRLARNYGQSAALQAGLDAARGSVVTLLDSDLQNDPADIPGLVEHLLANDVDVLVGWRARRQDNALTRTWPSRIANWLIGRVTGVRLHDYGCTLKVMRARVAKRLRLYGQMHRFIPAWCARHTDPARIVERPVNHRPRLYGRSNYGLARTRAVLLDLLSTLFFLRYSARPGHLFGSLGLALALPGAALLGHLLILKLGGADIGGRPALAAGVLLVVTGVQLVTTGVVAEMLARVYYERGARDEPYVTRDADEPPSDPGAGWHRHP